MSRADSSPLALFWTSVRDSLWFVPAGAALLGGIAALVVVRIPNDALGPTMRSLLFAGGAEGARGVLSTIAGSLITVTGVVFSVTIVALQLASSQFTPRVLAGFVADRINQGVLGVFIGTFTYTLLVLRTVRSASQDSEVFVPNVGVTLAVALLLLSVAALIVFINHSAQSIRASVIIARETRDALERIDQLFPRPAGVQTAREPGEAEPVVDISEVLRRIRLHETNAEPAEAISIPATRAGYLQAVRTDVLWDVGATAVRPVAIHMQRFIGEFVIPGMPLATMFPAADVTPAMVDKTKDAFVVGDERTMQQDVELGLIKLSDIAIKALSPGINDPTTALQCIDRLAQLLAVLGSRATPSRTEVSLDRSVVFISRNTTFDRASRMALDPIRYYGHDNAAVTMHLLRALATIAPLVDGEARASLQAQSAALLHASLRVIDDPGDRELLVALESS